MPPPRLEFSMESKFVHFLGRTVVYLGATIPLGVGIHASILWLGSKNACQETHLKRCNVGLVIVIVFCVILAGLHAIFPSDCYTRMRAFVTSKPKLSFYLKVISSTLLYFISNIFTLLKITYEAVAWYGVFLTISSIILEGKLKQAYYLNITTTLLSITIAMSSASLVLGDLDFIKYLVIFIFSAGVLAKIFWNSGGQSVGPVNVAAPGGLGRRNENLPTHMRNESLSNENLPTHMRNESEISDLEFFSAQSSSSAPDLHRRGR